MTMRDGPAAALTSLPGNQPFHRLGGFVIRQCYVGQGMDRIRQGERVYLQQH